jgi:class 3 adenylate cyclase
MRIGVLGPLEAFDAGGHPVELRRPKVRALLALLAADPGRTLSSDTLIAGLWGDHQPPSAAKTLQTYILQLRGAMSPATIVTEPGGYRLDVDRSQVDAFAFERLLAKARATTGDAAVSLFDEALSLWRGMPFVDVSNDEHLRPLRARLEEGRLAAMEGRIDALLAAGRFAEAVPELADLVLQHPLRERLWELYMTALARGGRQAEALRAFQDARRYLGTELGIEPGASLRQLEERLLAQDPVLIPQPAAVVPSKPTPPPTAHAVPRDERKVATALFVDVVGSTSLGERLDPEELKFVIGEALSRFGRVAADLGGTVTTMAGDGFLALFGAPITHEDDAERAVRAGLGIVEAAREYGGEVSRSFGVEGFAVRIGIDTGPVALGTVSSGNRSDYTGYGDPINSASRLQSLASPGSVLVGEHTHRLTERAFSWGERVALDAKGKELPVAAWEALKALPPGEGRRTRRLRAPLVGRQAHLDSALKRMEMITRGIGGVLLISGEPGIGKSRFIAELKEHFDKRTDRSMEATWLQGHGLSLGESFPYWPFREVLRDWLGVGPEEPELRVRVALHRRLEELMGGEADSYYPYLGSLLGLDLEPEATDRLNLSPESLQFRTFEVMVDLCRSLATKGPFVLVIDDVHWLDPTSLQLVEQLASLTDAEALLLVLAQRLDRDHPAWSLREEILRRFPHRTTEVRLEGLAEGDERNLLDALVGESTLPIEVGSRLLAAAEGNPFYLEELVGSLIDAGSLVLDANEWRFDHEVPIHLPETVEAVVMARIDRLDESVHDVLTSASVLGRTFGLPLLHQVVGQEAVVMDGLRNLQRLGLVDEARRWPRAEYRFKHALIQEAAYRTIPTERRVSVHRTAAAWLAAHEGREQEAGLLARHWLAAGDEEQAIPWLLRAGDQARREHALDEAIEHYQSLLALLERRGEKRSVALTLFKLGQALHTALRSPKPARPSIGPSPIGRFLPRFRGLPPPCATPARCLRSSLIHRARTTFKTCSYRWLSSTAWSNVWLRTPSFLLWPSAGRCQMMG